MDTKKRRRSASTDKSIGLEFGRCFNEQFLYLLYHKRGGDAMILFFKNEDIRQEPTVIRDEIHATFPDVKYIKHDDFCLSDLHENFIAEYSVNKLYHPLILAVQCDDVEENDVIRMFRELDFRRIYK